MTDRKQPTRSGSVELSESDLDRARGGFKSSDGILQKKATKPGPDGFSASGTGNRGSET